MAVEEDAIVEGDLKSWGALELGRAGLDDSQVVFAIASCDTAGWHATWGSDGRSDTSSADGSRDGRDDDGGLHC